MADFPALSIWTDAYLADTGDLSAEEHGVYLLLIMAAWRTPDCALPDDDVRLARFARVGAKKWKNIRPVMERFWTIDARGWTQKRLLEERARIETLRSQNSTAGKASARKRKETGSTSVGTEGATEKQLPIPSTSTQEESPPKPPQGGEPDSDLIEWAFGKWNELAGECGLPKAEVLTKQRRAAMRQRLKGKQGRDNWLNALAAVRRSPHWLGENGWTGNLDSLLREKNFIKLLEGGYEPKARGDPDAPLNGPPPDVEDKVAWWAEQAMKDGSNAKH